MISTSNLEPSHVRPLMCLACSDAAEVVDLHLGRIGAGDEAISDLPEAAWGTKYGRLIEMLPETDRTLGELEAELSVTAAGFDWRLLFRLPLEDHPFFGSAKLAAMLLSCWKASAKKNLLEKNIAAFFKDHSSQRPAAS